MFPDMTRKNATVVGFEGSQNSSPGKDLRRHNEQPHWVGAGDGQVYDRELVVSPQAAPDICVSK